MRMNLIEIHEVKSGDQSIFIRFHLFAYLAFDSLVAQVYTPPYKLKHRIAPVQYHKGYNFHIN